MLAMRQKPWGKEDFLLTNGGKVKINDVDMNERKCENSTRTKV